MASQIGSVILASAQSIGKVYVIGAVGFLAVKCTCLDVCVCARDVVSVTTAYDGAAWALL